MSNKIIVGSSVGYEISKYDVKSKIFNYLINNVNDYKLNNNF